MKTLINTGLKQIRIKILTFKDRIIKLLVTNSLDGMKLRKNTYNKNISLKDSKGICPQGLRSVQLVIDEAFLFIKNEFNQIRTNNF